MSVLSVCSQTNAVQNRFSRWPFSMASQRATRKSHVIRAGPQRCPSGFYGLGSDRQGQRRQTNPDGMLARPGNFIRNMKKSYQHRNRTPRRPHAPLRNLKCEAVDFGPASARLRCVSVVCLIALYLGCPPITGAVHRNRKVDLYYRKYPAGDDRQNH